MVEQNVIFFVLLVFHKRDQNTKKTFKTMLERKAVEDIAMDRRVAINPRSTHLDPERRVITSIPLLELLLMETTSSSLCYTI